MAVYAYDIEAKENAYVVIGKWKGLEHCEQRGIDNICR